jgi:2,3,4,5-tetrahydropyridine-2-carboxylate N-succinyltransferase/tetrahydrodipicolinate N-acetyltransferase
MNSKEIIDFISKSEKKTPIKLYVIGNNLDKSLLNYEYYGNEKSGIVFCEYKDVEKIKNSLGNNLEKYRIEMDRLNSAIPLADYSKYNARIEPGVYIRDMVEIGDGCVIMMGAVLNIGAQVGKNTMIDMNVVLGGRAIVGENCHIGAGSVLAGVIEPPSAEPVVIEDDVMIGANVVVLEGVKVGKGSVVAAGSVVVKDVSENTLFAGIPAKEIKKIDMKTKAKTQMISSLRQL